jgi:hypothetical protein
MRDSDEDVPSLGERRGQEDGLDRPDVCDEEVHGERKADEEEEGEADEARTVPQQPAVRETCPGPTPWLLVHYLNVISPLVRRRRGRRWPSQHGVDARDAL